MVCDTFLAGARGAEFVQPLHGSVAGGVEAKPRGEVRCRHRHGMGPRGDVAEKCQKNRGQTASNTIWYTLVPASFHSFESFQRPI